MTDRHQRSRELFSELRHLEPEQQRDRLDQLATTDPDLSAELAELLAIDERTGSDEEDFRSPWAPMFAGFSKTAAQSLAAVQRLEYLEIVGLEIDSVLGVGGFSVVYRALCGPDNRFGQPAGSTVALKVLRPSRLDSGALHQFEAESRALQSLEHPSVVRTHGFGRIDHGELARPYLVMPDVEGLALDDHCREFQPDSRERCRLLEMMLDAVHHAHTRGIVHGDLKPENLIVDATGHLTVVDFGLSCSILGNPGADDLAASEHWAGTIPFLALERLLGAPPTVQSDVFAAGVVTYVLFAGRHPYPGKHADWDGLLRSRRPATPAPIGRRGAKLPPGIELVLRTALHRDPAKRFASMAEFRDELRRCRLGEPVRLAAPSLVARFLEFRQRNARLVATLAAAFLLMAFVAGATVFALVRISDARDREAIALRKAEAARVSAESSRDYLLDVFRWIRGDVDWRSALARAEQSIRSDFEDDPVACAQIASAYGTALRTLGHYDESIRMLELQVDMLERAHGENAEVVRVARLELAGVRAEIASSDAARALAAESLNSISGASEVAIRVRARAAVQRAVAAVSARRTEEARQAARMALALIPSLESGRERWILEVVAMHQLARCYDYSGESDLAAEQYEASLRRARELGIDNEPRAWAIRSNHAVLQIRVGDLEEATVLLEEVLAYRMTHLGSNHIETLQSIHNLGMALLQRGASHEDGVSLLREAWQRRSETLGADHRHTLNSEAVLLEATAGTAPYDTVRSRFEALISRAEHNLGRRHPKVAEYWTLFARAARSVDRYQDALRALGQAYAIHVEAEGPDSASARALAASGERVAEASGDGKALEEWRARTR